GRSLTMASSLLLCAAHGTCRLLRGRGAPAARLRTDEEVEDLTDRTLPDRRLRERKVVLHDVAVASPVSLLQHIAGLGEVIDDRVGAALRDLEVCGDVTQARARIVRDTQQHAPMVGQEAPLRHPQ